MDPSGLRAALMLRRHRSFRRAALALDVSPTALSRTIAALEARLSLRLFHRTTRSVSPTDAAERLFVRIEPALDEIEAALAALREERATPSGLLRLNVSATALPLVSPVLAGFLSDHSAIRIELIASDRLVDIVREGFDAGIRLSEAVPADMVAVPCTGPLRFAVVAAPGYLARRGIPEEPAALAAHDCVRRRLADGRVYDWEFERDGRELRVSGSGALVTDHEVPMIAAARAGLGLAYVRSWMVRDELTSGALVEVLSDWTPPHPGFCLYWPGHRHVPAPLRALAAAFRIAAARGPGP